MTLVMAAPAITSIATEKTTSVMAVDGVTSTCKRLQYSQTFGGVSSVKVGRSSRLQMWFRRLLFVRIEIDKL